jgi:hypothetical protein
MNAGPYAANAAAVFAPHFLTNHGFAPTSERDALVVFLIDQIEKAKWERGSPVREEPPFKLLRSFTTSKLARRPLIEYQEGGLDLATDAAGFAEVVGAKHATAGFNGTAAVQVTLAAAGSRQTIPAAAPAPADPTPPTSPCSALAVRLQALLDRWIGSSEPPSKPPP